MKREIIDLFSELISYETTSDSESGQFPSTNTQISFGKLIESKLKEIGLENVNVDKYGYVTGELPANCDDLTTVGFISHMDTSPDCCGKDIKPMVIENYDGCEIERKGEKLSPNEFTSLKKYIGKTIICSDGTTLLGSDDKAGVTEILTAVKFLVENPSIKHCNVKVAFTPDEEIGAGVDYFDVEKFKCDYAYTVDGGELGEISYENFNAARAKIDIVGKSVHPGSSKNVMINAILIGCRINEMLPKNETPRDSEGYEGFYHLTKMEGNVENAHLDYIIRDFDKMNFEKRKNCITSIVKSVNDEYGSEIAKLDLYDEYYNMFEVLDKNKNVVDVSVKAIKDAGVEPIIEPIRGGTDGARLSFMGLPCPNLFTGGHNFHGPYEYVCVESMEKAVEVILNIVERKSEVC